MVTIFNVSGSLSDINPLITKTITCGTQYYTGRHDDFDGIFSSIPYNIYEFRSGSSVTFSNVVLEFINSGDDAIIGHLTINKSYIPNTTEYFNCPGYSGLNVDVLLYVTTERVYTTYGKGGVTFGRLKSGTISFQYYKYRSNES